MTMEEYNRMDAQMDARLASTTECVNNLRLARELNLAPELCSVLYQLTEKIAVMEWGNGTTIDDFSDPNFAIVSNGIKTKKL